MLALVAAGCGGGGGGDGGASTAASASCEVAAQNQWLRAYLGDWYYWSGSAPSPDPTAYDSLQAYFSASLYPGDASVPRDHWSYYGSSAAFDQFFVEGRVLGFGLAVNGLEGTLPLKIRYVEPLSPAGLAGLRRGDVIVSMNGRSAADLVAAGDYTALSPAGEGAPLSLEIADGTGTRTVALAAATHDLTPLSTSKVLTLPGGAKAGYLVLKDFITKAEAPLADAFAQFREAGATELILDLRYNGGGRVSTSNVLASLVSGATHGGGVFAELRYNARHQAANTSLRLSSMPGPAFGRVVILTGPRTCSASELVVNGLKPFADVVTIGGATCGKPFGFNPVQSCGNTFSAVNFESFNAAGQGRYYSGIAASCPVADDFTGELGDPAEALTAAAASYLQTGTCPPTSLRAQPLSADARRRSVRAEPGERQDMIP